jgi:hypothetical protein
MNRDLLAALLFALALGLPGCATTGGAPVEPVVASSWQAPLPHEGDVAELRRWWTQFDDPLLAQLIDAAEAASPTIASAAARIVDAQARRTATGAALLPALDATASASRGRQDISLPIAATSAGIGLQASWEIDVFGRNRAAAMPPKRGSRAPARRGTTPASSSPPRPPPSTSRCARASRCSRRRVSTPTPAPRRRG